MPVEIGEILHVLAHELRTPVGIAHGYVRLLLEGRVSTESERRRAVEQLQKALSRLTDLSHESSALANWLERDRAASTAVNARALLDRVTSTCETPVASDFSGLSSDAVLSTDDRAALEHAFAAMVRATLRELRGQPCSVTGRDAGGHVDVLIGDAAQFGDLSTGPEGSHASPIEIGRGGLGLSLVHASVVVESHGGTIWSAGNSRQGVGVRLPKAR